MEAVYTVFAGHKKTVKTEKLNNSRHCNMYRTYGQLFTPAISALPPSVAVVLG